MTKLLFRNSIVVVIVSIIISCFPVSVYAQERDCSQSLLRNLQVAMLDCDEEETCVASPIIGGGSLDRFLQVLSFQESRGNPKAQSKSSSASGKYQYIDKTWSGIKSLYGPAGQYAKASQAPEEIQDAVAYIEYAQKYKNLNSDLSRLAISHYLPSALTNPSKLDIVPSGGNKLTPRQYGEMLLQNISKGVGSDIPLKYSQAPEFAVWLEKAGGAPDSQPNTALVSPQNCGSASQASSSMSEAIVKIAQDELSKGAKESDGSYLKYTGGVKAAWCAYFVSWVLKEAGRPFNENGGVIPATAGILAFSKRNNTFHPQGEAGFVPQPGDIVIYKENLSPYPSHVNIVISYDPSNNRFTSIGGNESNMVKQASIRADLPAITGFMRLP